jgi:hypothetical protein
MPSWRGGNDALAAQHATMAPSPAMCTHTSLTAIGWVPPLGFLNCDQVAVKERVKVGELAGNHRVD